ncbi:hypothetical protein DENSPDRAFT_827146 [Dentipellis sp. KUC8613]|nr:hypothetical protein DENSPDRAFT_827146 [Dentipellis sp. KUC8613]
MDGEIVQVSLQSFMDNYAPFAPTEDQVQACIDILLQSQQLFHSKDGRLLFTACDTKPSVRFTRETSYEFLSPVCQVMRTSQIEGRQPSCIMEQKPYHTTSSEITGSTHKIDGYFKPIQSTIPDGEKENKTPTADIVVNCEWKLEDKDGGGVDNRRKVVSAACHGMNNDPLRQFTYSITTEDDAMTLWYWSRSHSAKSTSFEFTTDIHATVRAFASFIFATMEELGYDQSIRRIKDFSCGPGKSAFVFKVRDRYFKSLRCIAEHLGTCITGRATRVFEVIEVRSFEDLTVIGKKNQILKDVWLDANARTERQIQSEIFKELDKLAGDLCVEGAAEPPHFFGLETKDKILILDALRDRKYRQHFLTIECDEQGRLSKPMPEGAVPVAGLFIVVPPLAKPATLSTADKTRGSPASGPISASAVKEKIIVPRDYAPKRQYRVVSQEVCQALHNIDDLRKVLKAMKDCLLAVQLLFLIGWVHRDISSGNLLWYPTEDGGRGILSDLEYAKKCTPDGKGSRDPKTGTPYFMAVEIQMQGPIAPWLPQQLWRPKKASPPAKNAENPVAYNFQHDLESFFWLLLWTVTLRVDDAKLQAITKPMFREEPGCSNERRNAIAKGLSEEALEEALPEPIKSFAECLAGFAGNMLFGYGSRRSEDDLRNIATYSPLYGPAREIIDNCVKDAVGPEVLPLIVFSTREDMKSQGSRPLQPAACKRVRSATDDINIIYKSHKASENEPRSKPRDREL